MGFKSIILLNIGPGFGGFRLSLAAEKFHLQDSKIFIELQNSLNEIVKLFELTPYSQWNSIGSDSLSHKAPIIENRTGTIEAIEFDVEDDKIFILRIFCSFKYFPIGGYAVYDGLKISNSNDIIRLTSEELSVYW